MAAKNRLTSKTVAEVRAISAFTRVFDALGRASKDERPERLGGRPSRAAIAATSG